MLNNKDKERYSRHLLLDNFSEKEQYKLKKAKVLIVGIGGLGSPISKYLVAAGIGTIGIVDDDIVSESNLQRQILYNEEDIDKQKTEVAKRKLSKQNNECRIITYAKRFTKENATEIISEYDIVVDGTDNLSTRYIIDEFCFQQKKPFIYGSIEAFKGQVSVFNYRKEKRYVDLFPKENSIEKKSNTIGVIGALPGVIGSIQAMEVIKLVTNMGESLDGKLLLIDLLTNSFNIINY